MRLTLTLFMLLFSVFSFAQRTETIDSATPPAQQQKEYDPHFRGVTSPGMGPELMVLGLMIGFAIICIYVARTMARNNGGWYSRDGYRNRGIGFDDSYSRKHNRSAFSIFTDSSSGGGSSGGSSSSSSGSFGGGSSSGGGASGSW